MCILWWSRFSNKLQLQLDGASLESIIAQVPYAMKRIILGVAFCSFVLSQGLNSVMIIPLQHQTSIWDTGIISCGFWYALLHIIFCTISCFATAISAKYYAKRKREDVLPYEHIFAERYYSNWQSIYFDSAIMIRNTFYNTLIRYLQ